MVNLSWNVFEEAIRARLGDSVLFSLAPADTPNPQSLVVTGSNGAVQLWGFHDAVSVQAGHSTFNSEEYDRGVRDPVDWAADLVWRLSEYGLWRRPLSRRVVVPVNQAEVEALVASRARLRFRLSETA